MKKLKLGLVMAAVVPCFVLGLFIGFRLEHVGALSVNYFDDAGSSQDNCDLGNPRPGGQESAANCSGNGVRLMVGQGSKARDSIVQIGAYFKGLPTNLTNANLPGNLKLTIYGSNFCPEASTGANKRDEYKNGYYATHNLPVGTTVTNYTIGLGSGNPIVVTGEYRVASSNYCDSSKPAYSQVVNLDRANLFVAVDPVNMPGEYVVRIRAAIPPSLRNLPGAINNDNCSQSNENACIGLWNGFTIGETSGGAANYDDMIGTLKYNDDAGCDGRHGNCVSVRSQDYPGPNLTYKIRFGSDCSVKPGDPPYAIHFYDMDYAIGEDVRARLHDIDDDTWLSTGGANNWQPSAPSYANSKNLPRSDGDDSSFQFKATPGHRYVLEIMNIDPVLVFQYSTPFAGVFYKHPCNPATANVEPSVAISGNTVLEPGDNVTVTGKLSNESGKVSAQTTTGRFVAWYDTKQSDDYTGAAGQQLIGSAQSIGTLNYNPNQTFTYMQAVNSVSSSFSYVCGRIEATPGTNTTVKPAFDVTCKRIVYQPYLSIYGSDAIAGMTATTNGTTETCTASQPSDPAGFITWNNGGGAGWSGAGAQFAVQALGLINDFASGRGSNPDVSPNGLAFTNNASLYQPTATPRVFGGQFGAITGVACNYTSGVTFTNTITAGNYTNTGTSLASPANNQTILVKDHDAIITGNILYANNATWNLATIPSFKLVVQGGDILIRNTVTELNGTYVAEKNTSTNKGGTIYTCVRTSGTPYAPGDDDFYTGCNFPLTIYGSFVAQQVQFLRTFGTVGSASAGDSWNAGGAPAEKFVYGPEMWLANLKTQAGGTDASITGLPPTL